ncbi:hypothetical protein ES702_02881 [subsurface metagenome]
MKIRELLDDIKNLDLVLPEFQREYIWQKEQAKQLMVSLFKKYPTGSFLFWKTDNPPEIKNIEIPKDKIGSTKVILDGQQRLTTLYLFIRNQIPPYYKKYEIKNDPRNLYFNLENGEFQYYQPALMRNNPTWIPAIDCFDNTKKINVFKIAKEKTQGPEEQFKKANVFNENLTRLRNISEREYPIQAVPTSANIDEAIDVFDRVNSLGTKLSDADLALAHICGKWPEARRIMKRKIEDLAKRNFYFELGFLVRCLTGIVKGRALFEIIHQASRTELEEGWNSLTKVLDYFVNILPTHAYINSTADLNTTNVLVPVIVYLSKNETHFKNQQDMGSFIHWVYAAHTWARYTSQTDQRLDHDISIVLHSTSSHKDLIDMIIDQRGRVEVKPSDLEGRSTQHPLYRMTYILSKAKGAIDWFNGSPLAQTFGSSYKINSHHIFPTSLLYSSGKYSSKNHLHKKIVNEIANRAFLTSSSNIQISNKSPAEYLKEVQDKYPGALEKQFIPTDPSLWELDRYEDFLAKRRELIAGAINGFMAKLLIKIPEKKPETLDNYLAHGENATLEYKATLRWDTHQNKVNPTLQKVVAKTITGFLNTEGGTLLIGILDNGFIYGIEDDIKTLKRKDKDGFEQTLTQVITDYLGTEFCKYIHTKFEEKEDKIVCIIQIEKCPKPVFLNDKISKEFYIRAGNTVRPLDIESTHNYIGMHWEG